MKTLLVVTLSLVVSLLCAHASAADAAACPKTTSDDPLFGAAYPGWYGSEALAVQAPSSGVWATTTPGSLLNAKLAWRSPGFRPGTESNLKVSIANLNGGPMTAHSFGPTNMYPAGEASARLDRESAKNIAVESQMSPDPWRMLTGMDFPDEGCWRISAEYLGQVLTFVVETVTPKR